MSDKDQKDLPKSQEVADDGDIDNLSQTEKAAFEKIMAQIGEAEDDATDNTNEAQTPEPPSEESLSKEPPKDDHNAEPPEAKEDAVDGDSEQKDEDDFNDDQRAALDKIMGEISADEAEKPLEATSNDDSHEENDQQTSLDKIMAEIETEDANSGDAADDKELSDDQQAALDQILSEIKGDEAETASDTPAETDAPPSDPPSGDPQKVEASNGLSMEEFDDELSSLLSDTDSAASTDNKDAQKTPSDKEDSTPPDQSLEDINSALKDIVNASDEKETKEDPSDGSEKPQEKPEPKTEGLKEVAATPAPKKTRLAVKSKKAVWAAAITCSAAILAVGFYWGYNRYYAPRLDAPTIAMMPETPSKPGTTVSDDTAVSPLTTQLAPVSITTTTPKPNPFDPLKEEIHATRQYIQQKKEEVLELKRYYQNGIQKERSTLLANLPRPAPPFETALGKRPIELGLKSIQRRATYNLKLETPLAQVETHLEQLLYLERRIRLFELLDKAISGLSLGDLKRQGADLINKVRKEGEQLSVENVEVDSPSLASIWQELSIGDRGDPIADRATPHSNSQDQKIGKAICKGSFERKYLLTTLTTQTAKCLANWPGKDMYLNELTRLSPEAAKQLAQWQGEWLSLNGIKRLSPESASHLSKWPGKRLSLNGVTRLSDEATTYLAQWQGDQLEMVGLTSIGRWENYVTHLFLSEKLRRKLQVK